MEGLEALYVYIANKVDLIRKGSPPTFTTVKEELKCFCLWRAVFAEFLATLLFVFVGCASTIQANGDVVRIAFGFGIGIASMVQLVGHISGGHINPAVSIAMAIVLNISPVRALLYILAQCLGAIIGAFLLKGVAFEGANLGVTQLNRNINVGQGFAIEMILTFVLVSVIFATTDSNRPNFGSASLTIGLVVVLSHLGAVPLTGSSINPARSLGSAVAASAWTDHWVYWVGPILGGVAAALTYKYVLSPYRKTPTVGEALDAVTTQNHFAFQTVIDEGKSNGKESRRNVAPDAQLQSAHL